MFRVTTLDVGDAASRDTARDFFGKAAYLTVSGQLEGEAFACCPEQYLHVRPHVPGGKFQHHAPCGGVLDGRA